MLNIDGGFSNQKYLRAKGKISQLLMHALLSTCCHYPNYKIEKKNNAISIDHLVWHPKLWMFSIEIIQENLKTCWRQKAPQTNKC